MITHRLHVCGTGLTESSYKHTYLIISSKFRPRLFNVNCRQTALPKKSTSEIPELAFHLHAVPLKPRHAFRYTEHARKKCGQLPRATASL